MTCIPMNRGFICFAKIEFSCPYCKAIYFDANETMLDRINKNKCGYTKVKCKCGERFGLTGDYSGDFVTFKLDCNEFSRAHREYNL